MFKLIASHNSISKILKCKNEVSETINMLTNVGIQNFFTQMINIKLNSFLYQL